MVVEREEVKPIEEEEEEDECPEEILELCTHCALVPCLCDVVKLDEKIKQIRQARQDEDEGAGEEGKAKITLPIHAGNTQQKIRRRKGVEEPHQYIDR